MKKIHLLFVLFIFVLSTHMQAFNIKSFFSNLLSRPPVKKELTEQQLYDLHTGNYYFWLTKFDKAEQYYQKLDASGYVYAQRLLSTVYWGQGNYRKATECLLKQIKIASTGDAYRDLGNIYFNLGEDEKGLEYLKKAAALNYPLAVRDLTIYYFNKKIYSLAELYGRKAAELGNLEICSLLSTFFWNKKNYQKAEYFLSAAAQHDPTPHIHLSYIYNDVYNDQEKAVAILKEGLEKKNILCALELGNYYFSLRDYPAAELYYRQLIECSLDDIDLQQMMHKPYLAISFSEFVNYKNVAHTMLGHLYEDQGLDDQALVHFLVSAQQQNPQGQYALGVLYLRRGDTQSGLEYLKLSADQDYEMAVYTLGKYYFEQHELIQAKNYLDKCASTSYPVIARYAHLMLGHMCKEENNVSQALVHFKYAADTNDSIGCYEYASLMEARGNIDEAQHYYRKAAELGCEQAQAKLQLLQYYPAS